MKKKWLFVLTLATALSALTVKADIIECVFTEPFVTTDYSTGQSTLTSTKSDGTVNVIQNVSIQDKGGGVSEIVSKERQVLQTLTLDYKGSDGMSDTVYPYSAVDASLAQTSNLGIGGCITKPESGN